MGSVSIPNTNISFRNVFCTYPGFQYGSSSTSMNSVLSDGYTYPTGSSPYHLNYYSSGKFCWISLQSNNTSYGTVEITYPISLSGQYAGYGYQFWSENVNYVTIIAVANYGYSFDAWRTADNGGGSILSTDVVTSIYTSSWTGYNTWYAHFY